MSRAASAPAAKEVLRRVRMERVRFIEIWFVDILGHLKSFSITPEELPQAFTEGMGFDGSSIEGFARIEESDLLAVPDPSTYALLPWKPEGGKVARMFSDILTPDRRPYEGDTRFVLKRNLQEAARQGFTFFVGPELEYFYFKDSRTPSLLDQAGYFDAVPLDEATELREETSLILERMGIKVEYTHHEVAPSQHEIDLRYAEALVMADQVMTYKMVVKKVARQHGVFASFMPKPIEQENGSGMHVHQSLFKGGRNAFFDARDPHHLSAVGRGYLAGALHHVKELVAVTNQWVNSFKRLVPGYEAPAYVSWGRRNRSALVRVPMYKPGKEQATRLELRFPDPACNPYLAFAAMLSAGLQGIKDKRPAPDPVEEDIFSMSEEDRRRRGVDSLPGSLIEAVAFAKDSPLLRRTLGDHVFNQFIRNKLIEWDRYRTKVTDFEREHYLPLL